VVILPGAHPDSIAAGARCLSAGGLLGLPTETVYGLAADACNDAAVAQIFAAKGRPAGHPLIVHIARAELADHFTHSVPDFARALMAAFWPGPLTLILPRRPGVANVAAGDHATIGLRCPSHPVAQSLLRSLANSGGVIGIAAPSANHFGRVSPTTAAHVQAEFGEDLLILDGGPCRVGIESTIIDCTRGLPVLLRPGGITTAHVQAACDLKVLLNDAPEVSADLAPKASGTLDSHYAPRAKVRLMTLAALRAELARLDDDAGLAVPIPLIAVYSRTALARPPRQVLYRQMPDDAVSTAQQLFAALRDFDAQGVQGIWVETLPDAADWDGVRDRLSRAAG
jgi:L-threonylcarbamoyladenylate synthase